MKKTQEKVINLKNINTIKKLHTKPIKESYGITLIALVVTIVVLLILAGITINLLFSNGGIFDIANQSKPAYEIGALKDRINNVIADWSIERLTKPETTVDDLWEKMVVDNIIDNPEEDVEGPEKVGENDSYDISTNEGYIVEIIIMPDGEIIFGEITEGDSLPPKILEIKTTSTTSSIYAEVSMTRFENGTLSYYYKKKGEEDSSYKALKEEVTDLTANFTGLEQNVEYNIKVIAKTKNGSTQKVVNEITRKLKDGTITQKGPTVWSNETASIELETTQTGVSIQYQIDGIEGEWQDYKGSIAGLKHKQTVYAVITDGTNQSGHNSINILDEQNPQKATINPSTYNTTAGSNITATVTHIDNESGVAIENCKWIYNTNSSNIGTNESNYTNTFSSNGQSITLNASTPGTYYLHVLTVDKAGNSIETIANPITVINSNVGPSTPSVNYSNKTTNSITVTANATDENNDSLTYSLYVSTSQSSGFTHAATSSPTSSGSTVTLTASNLSEYTYYYYYVTVTDGQISATSSTSSAVRTFCPGNTSSCSGGKTQESSCSSCSGRGRRQVCTRCGAIMHNLMDCFACGNSRYRYEDCTACNGTGDYTTFVPCTHGFLYAHSYCSHGYTSQHD